MTTISQLGRVPYSVNVNRTRKEKTNTPIHNSENNYNDKIKKRAKFIAGALGTLAIIAGLGYAVVSRGRAVQNKKLLTEIPKDLQVRFEKIKKLESKEFVDKAYAELVEHMNLKGIAPQSVGRGGADICSVIGGYNTVENTIKFSDGFFNRMSQKEQINMLSHELKHCEQFTNMLRTEGIGVEKYVESEVEFQIKEALRPGSLSFGFKSNYKKAVENGTEKEFLDNIRKRKTEKFTAEIKENFKETLALPKIKADSPKGIKAFKDLEANKNYEGLNILGMGSAAYRNNPLEVEAYSFGEKMEKLFNAYMKA